MQKIKRAPGYTSALSSEVSVVEARKKNREPTYFVRFKFLVNGTEYKAVTTPTDKAGAVKYLSAPSTQVVYYIGDPSINTLKRYFDLRRNDSLFEELVVVGVASVAFALPLSLFWSWFPGWIRTKFG